MNPGCEATGVLPALMMLAAVLLAAWGLSHDRRE
jgi:uncharacterized protein (TIGR03382 family)